ncbi:MAG TPA: serine/threonine-protein kinase [Thermoanaerobaculia bacterium]|nr:serine/threonine-protein kinase [Thermoanaerobaculia bacterium]
MAQRQAMPEDSETHSLRPGAGTIGAPGARIAVAATEPVGEALPGEPLHGGELLGRYFILHELGRGGMGVVYAAYDPELDRKIALKLLHPGRSREGVGQARLLREAQALARLAHPNVVHVYDAGTAGDRVFVAMELAEGESLDTWLETQERPWRQILTVFQAAGRGLAAAHAAGLLHRDFKPGNVLLGQDGRVRVLDFGIARPTGGEDTPEPAAPAAEAGRAGWLTTPLTRAGVVVGTPRYMAPEALRGGRLDARADQYSFCVALHEALYGFPPYEGNELLDLLEQTAHGRIREPPAGSRVPAWVRRILLRGLATDPQQRYPSMDALLADLGRDRSAALRRRGAGGALLVLLAAGAFAFYEAGQRQARLCTGGGEKLAGVWDAGRKAAIRRAFLASGRPYAADAWKGVEKSLDAYTRSWASLRTEACEATRVRREQSPELLDLRMQCLDRRLRDVRALTDLFAAGGAGLVEKAVQASHGLPGLDECADATALTAPLRPPTAPAARRALDAVETQVAKARTLWTTGRYGEGLPVAAAAVEAASKLGYPPAEAEALRVRAMLEESSSRYEAAEKTLFQALAAAARGRDDALAAHAWIDLVWMSGFRLRKYEEGKRWAQLAEASLARLGGSTAYPEMEADLQSNLGSILDEAGDHAGGLALEQQALALYEKTLGADHPAVGRTLNRIGNAWYNLKRYPEALGVYRQSLEQARRSLGPRHPTVAVRLGNLALILDLLGRFDESLALQLEALGIEEQALGANHPRISITHGNLAALLLTMERPAEALEHARRGLAIAEADPDAAPEDLGASLINVADSLYHLERYKEALDATERAYALLLKSVGANHPWAAQALSTRGQILRAQGHPALAITVFHQSLAAYQAAGETSTEVGWTRFSLARALWDVGRRQEAFALAREARRQTSVTRQRNLRQIDAWLAGKR